MTDINYAEEIGKRIREVRKRADLGQVELADQLDVTRQSISGYETERLRPSFGVINKICTIYGVYPWWLVYGIHSEPPGDGDSITGSHGLPGTPGRNELTNSQRVLIEYIKSNRDAATKLGQLLWDKALNL